MIGQFNTLFPTEVFDKISIPTSEPIEDEIAEPFDVTSEDSIIEETLNIDQQVDSSEEILNESDQLNEEEE